MTFKARLDRAGFRIIGSFRCIFATIKGNFLARPCAKKTMREIQNPALLLSRRYSTTLSRIVLAGHAYVMAAQQKNEVHTYTQPVAVEGLRWGRIAVLLLFRVSRRVLACFLAADSARCMSGSLKRGCRVVELLAICYANTGHGTAFPCRVIDSGQSVKIYPSPFSPPSPRR